MDFKKRFEGRTGHMNKNGNIIEDSDKSTFYLSKPYQSGLDDFSPNKRQNSFNNAQLSTIAQNGL